MLSAGSGHLGLGFRSALLLLTQQKGTEFSDLFRVLFANLPKQGEAFLCSSASPSESSCQHAAPLPTAQPDTTQSPPSCATAGFLLQEGSRGGVWCTPDTTFL